MCVANTVFCVCVGDGNGLRMRILHTLGSAIFVLLTKYTYKVCNDIFYTDILYTDILYTDILYTYILYAYTVFFIRYILFTVYRYSLY